MADSLINNLAERDVELAITALKKGSYLLKYGRRGKPKFCPFQLSTDESALLWYSGKEEKQIKLNQVLRIIPGQRTATFKRYPRPEKEYQSFSLICPERSLDLICKDKDEAEVWFVGLKALITRGKVHKWRNNIKSEIASPVSPTARAQNISPFVTLFDPVIQQPPENTAQQNRLGKVFCDIVSLTAPTSNNQADSASNPLSPLSPGNAENPSSRSLSSEPVRCSISSAVSSSSHGSYQEDSDALGDVFIWGEGISDGVLGGTRKSSYSTTEDALLPKTLESTVVLDVQNIACGRSHAVLVTKQGEIFSWGEGSGGKLGHGLEADGPQPKLISSLRGMSIEVIACGDFHTCAVTLSGDLYTWGDGTRMANMLGHGSEASHWNPKRVTGLIEGMHVSYVSCGPWHTAAVTSSGQLFTFGDGSFGALGHGDRSSISVPREVESLSGLRTTRVACGVWHTAAVVEKINEASDSEPSSSSGQLYTWGDGDESQLGHGDNDTKLLPECVTALADENIRQVACGHSLTAALTTKGHVYTMGSQVYGQLGNPVADGKVPTRVDGKIVENPVEEIACGSYHVAVLTRKSEVFTWGKGSNGQLGHGNVENKKKPAVIEFLRDRQVKALTCGPNSTAVICIHKWVPGSDHSACAGCRNPFNFRRKRHNCYNCGLVFCKVCTSRKSQKAALAPDMNKPYRVCYGCFNKLKKATESSQSGPTPKARIGNKWKSTDVSDREALAPKHLSQQSGMSSFESMVQVEGRQLRRDARSEANDRSLFTTVNANLVPFGLPSPKGSTSPASLPKHLSDSIPGSRASSHTNSPASVKSSPPPSHEVTAEESKQMKHSWSQEIASLRAQVERLTCKTQYLEEELDKTRKQLKEVTALAADEAEESRSAKDVIRSLTTQLKEMAESLSQKDGTSSNTKPAVKDTSDAQQTKTFNQTHTRSKVPLDNGPKSNVANRTLANGSKTQNERVERVVQDEPGVYLTLLSLPGGGNELKRVRFSRKNFTEEEAEKWWAENGGTICERHKIRVT